MTHHESSGGEEKKRQQFHVKLPSKEVADRLKQMADEQGMTQTQFVVRLLTHYEEASDVRRNWILGRGRAEARHQVDRIVQAIGEHLEKTIEQALRRMDETAEPARRESARGG